MSINKTEFAQYVQEFSFRELFNDLGWNNNRTSQTIQIGNDFFNIQGVAEKSGFKILLCNPLPNGEIPDYNTRKKIETKITKLFQEHLIIFFDDQKHEQIWQLVVRQTGKPTKATETRYHISQDPELLYQRAAGIFFELDEEDNITIVDVTLRVTENFQQNNERVTKKFYDEFRNEHKSFISFIKGIDSTINREWYSSLMLNRLMFCYFIQKKGFLDNNKNYLRDKLNICQERKGKNKFYSFYRDFLLVLFHQGLNEPSKNEKAIFELGRIPYLNGGMFDEHELEKEYNNIEIDDKAFENIFDFFDEYNWHLDTRIDASGKDINPDVIGYIFEKYINDRAQMGAYYTKEDITEYISKNCVLPYLFEETKRQYVKAFIPKSVIWQMVKESSDKYIYEAVKHGVHDELPEEVVKGIENIDTRTEWNNPAPIMYALPTEIWREVIARRNRYTEVKTKIEEGKVTNINDFITYNLNIRQFVQDIIENTNDTELLKSLYKALTNITILDPTCGSGAFLFAAMNILEPLYEACIQRMENFVAESPKGKYKYFEEVLTQVKSPAHPNLQYFIYKSIILNNLYGVDIMKEAVEIAKLRLFLKLVATVDADYHKPNLGLEPLPDIDFNIRAGNTLVGFATETELDKAFEGKMDFDDDKGKIKEKCDVVARTFSRYKDIQLTHGDDFESFKKAKEELNKRLKELNNELSLLLHKHNYANVEYNKWLASHQPFHWFAEFYEIIHDRNGFDVVIGNPPYVEYSSVRNIYSVNGFETIASGNLYAFIIERAVKIQKEFAFNGMIIPLSAYCTDRMEAFQKFELGNCSTIYLSNYAERPSKLFEGAERSLTIALFQKVNKAKNSTIYTTYYYKWNSSFREYLFDNISYIEAKKTLLPSIIPKVSQLEEIKIIETLHKVKRNIGFNASRYSTRNILYYRNSGGRYWKIITDFQPEFYLDGKRGISSRESYLYFNDDENLKIAVCVLNSSLYYWYYVMHSDARTNNPSDLKNFPIDMDTLSMEIRKSLVSICARLMSDIEKNSVMQQATYQTGNVEFQQFFPQKSKPIIDEIDKALAEHYGFTEGELDFIINYDIKYRMGKELEEKDEL